MFLERIITLKEVGGKNQDYNDLEKIGKSFGNTGSVGSSYSMGTDTSGGPSKNQENLHQQI